MRNLHLPWARSFWTVPVYQSNVVPSLMSSGWFLSKTQERKEVYFLRTVHMKNLQAKGLVQQKWYILVIISLGIIIINSTLCFVFCSSWSEPQGRAVAVWWWWTLGLAGGNKIPFIQHGRCQRSLEIERKKTKVFTLQTWPKCWINHSYIFLSQLDSILH